MQNAVPFRDGGGIVNYRSLDRSIAEIAHFSATDAERYRPRFDEYREIIERVIEPMRLAPPLPRLRNRSYSAAARSAAGIWSWRHKARSISVETTLKMSIFARCCYSMSRYAAICPSWMCPAQATCIS